MIILIYYESYELQKFSMANKPSSSGNLGYTSYLIFLIIIIQRKKLQPNSHILDRFFFFWLVYKHFFATLTKLSSHSGVKLRTSPKLRTSHKLERGEPLKTRHTGSWIEVYVEILQLWLKLNTWLSLCKTNDGQYYKSIPNQNNMLLNFFITSTPLWYKNTPHKNSNFINRKEFIH